MRPRLRLRTVLSAGTRVVSIGGLTRLSMLLNGLSQMLLAASSGFLAGVHPVRDLGGLGQRVGDQRRCKPSSYKEGRKEV